MLVVFESATLETTCISYWYACLISKFIFLLKGERNVTKADAMDARCGLVKNLHCTETKYFSWWHVGPLFQLHRSFEVLGNYLKPSLAEKLVFLIGASTKEVLYHVLGFSAEQMRSFSHPQFWECGGCTSRRVQWWGSCKLSVVGVVIDKTSMTEASIPRYSRPTNNLSKP